MSPTRSPLSHPGGVLVLEVGVLFSYNIYKYMVTIESNIKRYKHEYKNVRKEQG